MEKKEICIWFRYSNLVSVFTILLSKNKIKYRINIQTDFCKILLENRLMKFFCEQIRIQRVEILTFLSYSLLQLFSSVLISQFSSIAYNTSGMNRYVPIHFVSSQVLISFSVSRKALPTHVIQEG